MVADLDDSIKRISSAIQAFVIYQRTYPEDQFAIVGGGPDEEKLKEYLGKFDGVNFMGRMTQPQAMEELSKCHATIINSRVETFSVVALESAALGNFTLSTPCGGPEETAKDTSALILEDFERTTLIQAMKQVRTSYEAKGLPKPQKLASYSQEAIGEKLEEIYSSVVKSSTPT
jgi:glycosyltransferase involved in cell wall biosynthesis